MPSELPEAIRVAPRKAGAPQKTAVLPVDLDRLVQVPLGEGVQEVPQVSQGGVILLHRRVRWTDGGLTMRTPTSPSPPRSTSHC